ncbi:MAG: hypothetical protein ACYC92_14085, partial [Candidatus Acidiferrales bacterium]
LRGNRSLQKPKENADSSSRLLVGMTTNRVFQQAASVVSCKFVEYPSDLQGLKTLEFAITYCRS